MPLTFCLLVPQVGAFASAAVQSFLPLPQSFNCHSNTVITSSFFTANEKVKYECLASTVISDSSSLSAGAERQREHTLISTWKPLVNYAISPQTTCTSVSVQLWSQIMSLALFHSSYRKPIGVLRCSKTPGHRLPASLLFSWTCYVIIEWICTLILIIYIFWGIYVIQTCHDFLQV